MRLPVFVSAHTLTTRSGAGAGLRLAGLRIRLGAAPLRTCTRARQRAEAVPGARRRDRRRDRRAIFACRSPER